jgi:hypothetical protein
MKKNGQSLFFDEDSIRWLRDCKRDQQRRDMLPMYLMNCGRLSVIQAMWKES